MALQMLKTSKLLGLHQFLSRFTKYFWKSDGHRLRLVSFQLATNYYVSFMKKKVKDIFLPLTPEKKNLTFRTPFEGDLARKFR
jgi:hypothetical protein